MIPGTDLRAVALPEIPQGHRWVIDHNYLDGWSESRVLGIHLQKFTKGWFRTKWKNIDSRKIAPEYKGAGNCMESMVECAERQAQAMKKKHIKLLETMLEVESIVGIYEQGKKQALS